MGMRSFMYGYIDEARPGSRSEGSLQKLRLLEDLAQAIATHNEATLSALPIDDEWPPLNRHLFAWPPRDANMINYKGRLFHFALSLKEVDWDFREWLNKFEGTLRSLYWEQVVLHFSAANFGEHRLEWRPKREWVDRLKDGVLEPIAEWDFETTMNESELEAIRTGYT